MYDPRAHTLGSKWIEPTGDLVARVRNGDREEFGRLYAKTAPALFAWASLRLRRPMRVLAEPDDLLQEVWFRALERLDTVESLRTSFRAWLFGIAKMVLLETLRTWERVGASPRDDGSSSRLFDRVEDSVTSIATALARDEAVRAFLAWAEELEDDDRKLVIHCGLEGLPCSEVAQRLGIAHETAMKRWQRLRERLRDDGSLRAMLLDGP